MSAIPHSLIALAETLELRWKSYREGGDSDVFVEFTLSLNSLTEQLSQQHLPGLVRACQELENTALSLFGDSSTHPITDEEADAIEHQLGIILTELHRHETPAIITRRDNDNGESGADVLGLSLIHISEPTRPY